MGLGKAQLNGYHIFSLELLAELLEIVELLAELIEIVELLVKLLGKLLELAKLTDKKIQGVLLAKCCSSLDGYRNSLLHFLHTYFLLERLLASFFLQALSGPFGTAPSLQ